MASIKATRKTQPAKKVAEVTAAIDSAEVADEHVSLVPTEVDINQFITVRNGFQGKLIYQSSRTGEVFIWDEFGGEQEIELKELKNVKNTAKVFFTANWFMFNKEDDWVIDYLGLRQYYKNALGVDEFDSVFEMGADEARELIGTLSEGQRKSVAYLARQKIANGEIDSMKLIKALEESLGINLVER